MHTSLWLTHAWRFSQFQGLHVPIVKSNEIKTKQLDCNSIAVSLILQCLPLKEQHPPTHSKLYFFLHNIPSVSILLSFKMTALHLARCCFPIKIGLPAFPPPHTGQLPGPGSDRSCMNCVVQAFIYNQALASESGLRGTLLGSSLQTLQEMDSEKRRCCALLISCEPEALSGGLVSAGQPASHQESFTSWTPVSPSH